MRISKRTREQAALICAIAASGGVWRDAAGRRSPAYLFIAEEIDATGPALHLAVHAYHHMTEATGGTWTREVDAEAESDRKSVV